MPKGTVQAERGRVRREAIVASALKVFATKGFRAGALTEVAEAAGITAAAILYHFGSKEALLLEVILERDRRAAAMAAERPPSMGLASLRGLVVFAELCEREPGLAGLHTVLQIESFEPGTPAHDYFRDRSAYLRRELDKTLVHAKRLGEIRSDVDCRAKAEQIVAFLEGAAVLWLMDPRVSLVSLYAGFIDTVIADMTR